MKLSYQNQVEVAIKEADLRAKKYLGQKEDVLQK